MKRDMTKLVKEVAVPSAYDMTTLETCELMDKALTGDSQQIFEAINTAFRYGFALGRKAEQKETITTATLSNYVELKEYARLHDVDVSTVRKKIKNNNFPFAVRVGRIYLIPSSAPWLDMRSKSNRETELEQ